MKLDRTLAAVVLSMGLVAAAWLVATSGRYVLFDTDGFVLDTWTGEVCAMAPQGDQPRCGRASSQN